MSQEARKVVVLPCSGIGKVYGAMARETTYELMDRVRPGVVVTTCLPLLVIDDPEAKRLVTENPVITIDGCPKSCAHKERRGAWHQGRQNLPGDQLLQGPQGTQAGWDRRTG